ncbi:MAG: hypothetical protein AAFQ51_19835 [Pseudomonadota bacterium]
MDPFLPVFVIVLFGVYATLVLMPAERLGIAVSAGVTVLAALMTYRTIMTVPSNRFVDLGPYFGSMVFGAFFGAAVSALVYHLVHAKHGHSGGARISSGLFMLIPAGIFGFGAGRIHTGML